MQYIDYHAIAQNGKFFKNLLGSSKLCAVIKCDAYGHGIVRVAGCLRNVADCFAVGTVDEANQIACFGKPILILLPQNYPNSCLAVKNGYTLTLDSFETLNIILRCQDVGNAKVHIKIDSGMNRLGFSIHQLPLLLDKLSSSNVQVEGVFSHFWGQNKNSCDEQLNYFEKCSKIISNRYINACRHIANTNGVLLDKKYHLDMARVGLGLFGYGDANLLPAKTVTAKVLAIKSVKKGQVVGYDGRYVFPCDTTIAVVNYGYADGLPKCAVHCKVKIGCNLCNVVGNICMSMLMVDVGNLPVAVGDEVVILGQGVNSYNANLSIYELLCNLR